MSLGDLCDNQQKKRGNPKGVSKYMVQRQSVPMDLGSTSPYKASLTREHFLFYEMRTTAKLMSAGLTENQIVERTVAENLFQYPTEKSIKRMALACISRLSAMNDDTLVQAIATQSAIVAKQIGAGGPGA
jgi:hypothetical protein